MSTSGPLSLELGHFGHVLCLATETSTAMSFTRRQDSFGSVGGQEVTSHTISNSTGMSIQVLNYGATLIGVSASDRNGISEEVTLNYRNLDELVTNHGPYYGCIAGRVANRIRNGKFSVDGVDYSLAINNWENSLHGGAIGFDQKIWTAVEIKSDYSCGVELSYTSPDGEEGYPGNLKVCIRRMNQPAQLLHSVMKEVQTDCSCVLSVYADANADAYDDVGAVCCVLCAVCCVLCR
jgi:hypothetical protein